MFRGFIVDRIDSFGIYIYIVCTGKVLLLFINMDYVYLSKMFANFNPCIIYLLQNRSLPIHYVRDFTNLIVETMRHILINIY